MRRYENSDKMQLVNFHENSFSASIKSYSLSSSTSNLTKHLSLVHDIVDGATITSKSEQTLQKFFSTTPRSELNTTSATNLKRKFVIDIVLLCCRDLLPFDIVTGEGWMDFCQVSFSFERFSEIYYQLLSTNFEDHETFFF